MLREMNCSLAGCAASAADDKRFRTLQARAAIAGHGLNRSAEDGREMFVVSRCAWTREFRNLDEIEDWLERVEGVGRPG